MKTKTKTLIALDRDPSYAPCSLFICRVTNPEAGEGKYDWNTRDERNTVLVQTDQDHPSIAESFGWRCPAVDGDEPTDADCKQNACGANSDGRCKCVADCVSAFLDDCVDNATVVEDPGYFDEYPPLPVPDNPREESEVEDALFAVAESDDDLRAEWYDVRNESPERLEKIVTRLSKLTYAQWAAFQTALDAIVNEDREIDLFAAIDAAIKRVKKGG